MLDYRQSLIIFALLLGLAGCEETAAYSCGECRKACAPAPVQECSYAKCVCYHAEPQSPSKVQYSPRSGMLSKLSDKEIEKELGYIAPCPAGYKPNWIIICRLPDGGIARPRAEGQP